MKPWMRAMVACAAAEALAALAGCESDNEDDAAGAAGEAGGVTVVTNVVVSGGQTNVTITPLNLPIIPLTIFKPDLKIVDLSASPASFFGWQVRVTVKNIGKLNSGGFKIKLYRDGASKDTVSIPGLLTGAQATFTFPNYNFGCPAQANPPNYTMRAVADADNEIGESDETNNAYQESWGCPPP
jgi:subtilase family serine protease